MILPLIEMQVYDPVSSYRVEPIGEIDVETDFPFSFAIKIFDDGLSGLNIEKGDILLFQDSWWPDVDEQIVLVCFENEEYYLRILHQMDSYGRLELRGTGDVSPIKTTKQSVIVKGVCCHVMKINYNQMQIIDTRTGEIII